MAHIWNKFRFQGSWTMIGSMASRRETLHIVRIGVRRALSLAAIYVIALHTILLGLVPVSAGELVVGDPLSVDLPSADGHGRSLSPGSSATRPRHALSDTAYRSGYRRPNHRPGISCTRVQLGGRSSTACPT